MMQARSRQSRRDVGATWTCRGEQLFGSGFSARAAFQRASCGDAFCWTCGTPRRRIGKRENELDGEFGRYPSMNKFRVRRRFFAVFSRHFAFQYGFVIDDVQGW